MPATSARRWSTIPGSTRWRSPDRPRSAGGSSVELAGTGRKITLELGGKAANIVFDDAAQDQAIEGIVNGIFFNQGQVCCAGSRLLVQESIADEFVERLTTRVETLRVGDPMDKNTDIGAINSSRPARPDHDTDATPASPRAPTAWTSSCPLPKNGFFIAPTIFTDATPSMRIAREEIFGPVLSMMTFRTPDEAVTKANNTAYGLSAGVWTEKGSRAMGMAAALRAGVIWDNTFNRFDPAASFGGYKESGFGREGGRSGHGRVPEDRRRRSMSHLTVAKTYKLYIGGAFPRSESGRTYPALDASGGFLANAALASRKDARDAVAAARKAFGAWAKATAYNRGQVIYRIAEMLEGRAGQFTELIMTSTAAKEKAARAEVEAAVDRLVHYAGWTDKLAAVLGSANPVSGPYFSYSAPEPTGVVAIMAPTGSPLLGLVSVIAPAITSGNACVVVAAEPDPCVAIAFAEVLATSDLPGGVINILTGNATELAPHLAAHADVNALDLTGVDGELRISLEQAAAETVKRVYAPPVAPDFTAAPGLARLRAFLEIKTVWHPTGALSLSGGSAY